MVELVCWVPPGSTLFHADHVFIPQNPKTPYVSDVRELYLIYSFVQIYSSMSSQRRFGASRTAMRHDPQLLKYVLLLRYG